MCKNIFTNENEFDLNGPITDDGVHYYGFGCVYEHALDLVHIHHQMISILFQNPLAMSEGCILEMMQDFIHITDHNSKLYIYYLN